MFKVAVHIHGPIFNTVWVTSYLGIHGCGAVTCQSIRGYPSYLEHPWLRRICYLHPLCQSIRGYPSYLGHASVDGAHLLPPSPLSEYPRIPKLLGASVDGAHLLPPSPLSEYPRIPKLLGASMDEAHLLPPSLLSEYPSRAQNNSRSSVKYRPISTIGRTRTYLHSHLTVQRARHHFFTRIINFMLLTPHCQMQT